MSLWMAVSSCSHNTRGHCLIVGNIANTFDFELDRKQWDVLMHFGVDAGRRTFRDADIVVDRRGGSGSDCVAHNPALLVEVVSPSSEARDLEDKPAEYLQLPNLVAYLVVAQVRPKAWIWQRESGGFATTPREVVGLDQTVRVAALNLDGARGGLCPDQIRPTA